ncbi:MAG: hypothetical protein IJA02_02180 [Clostridia bacterium]|nr:hypothetical protein [Clostridia bacterium]MBR6619260.1 hypothetical protein [Clostridia bacterium]
MKLYNKPELNVEAFDIEDVITTSGGDNYVTDNDDAELNSVSAGMEFSIAANGNDEF